MSDAAAEFWRFSLAIYASPGVAPACLRLQDEHGKDVNVLLFCCWLGASGRGRLSTQALDDADKVVAPWRHGVVEHVRAARRAIKALAMPGSENLYSKAKAVELEAERLLQTRLAAIAPPTDSRLLRERRLADALANLALYADDDTTVPICAALAAMARNDFEVGIA